MGIIQSIECLARTKRWRKGELVLRLSWDICLLLPMDICAPGVEVFGLRLRLILYWLPWLTGPQVWTGPIPPAFLCLQLTGKQIMRLLSLHNQESQLFFLCIYVYPFGSVPLGEPSLIHLDAHHSSEGSQKHCAQ